MQGDILPRHTEGVGHLGLGRPKRVALYLKLDPLESSVGNNLPWARRIGSNPVTVDLLKTFAQPPKGAKNATRTKPRRATRPAQARAVRPAARPAGGNVAPLRADAAGDAASSAQDDNAVGRSDAGKAACRAPGALEKDDLAELEASDPGAVG